MVGSAVVRACVARGIAIRAHLGPPGAAVVPPPAGVESAFAEIDNVEAMTELCRDVTAVVHLAGPPSVAKSFQTPAEYVRAHSVGTASILEACRANAVRRLIYISSAEVYGPPQMKPVREDHPRRPKSPYAIAKVCSEDLISACAPTYGILATILRPFSVIGPPVAAHSVLGSIIRQAMAGPTVAVFAPHIVRDYLFVDDLADAILSSLEIQGKPGEVSAYNIGSGVGTSVAELAGMVQAKLGRLANVCTAEGFDRPEVADIRVLVADVSRARNDFDWQPKTPLSEALSLLISVQQKQEHDRCVF